MDEQDMLLARGHNRQPLDVVQQPRDLDQLVREALRVRVRDVLVRREAELGTRVGLSLIHI